jgi:anti-sigma regulatory factor (Ser/Thr protein kinase)
MDNNQKFKNLQLINDISQLSTITDFVENLVEEWELSPGFTMSLNLVLEEAFTNVVFYAYNDEKQHLIDLNFEKNGEQLKIVLTDDGSEYDPTQKLDPDFDLPIEKRSVGGLGIFLIKKIMDTVEYQRKENKNYLVMTKILKL